MATSVGCSSTVLSLGNDGPDANATFDASDDATSGDTGRADSELAVRIELPNGARVDGITVGCSNPCIDVQAVATGGQAPYRFAWDDGTTSPTRHLCPEATHTFGVTATDSRSVAPSPPGDGIPSDAMAPSPAPATASLVAQVEACGDGSDGRDAGGPACAAATSFAICSNLPDQSLNLASPLVAGREYTLHITGAGLSLSAWQIDYWGTGETGCVLEKRLGGFTNTTLATIVDLCVRPSESFGRIVSHLAGAGSPGLGFLSVSVCDGCADAGP